MPAQAGGGTKPWQGWESGERREEVRQLLVALMARVLSHVTMWCGRLEQGLKSPGSHSHHSILSTGAALVDGLIVFCYQARQVKPKRDLNPFGRPAVLIELLVLKKDSNPF